ncbi:beta-glucoside-specific PTS transporter subunit IIABC [Pseudolactococcus piscium]|nr:beta-glucoside-specific PTS transporter subunit IIABC [Lactococcus piscium]
MEVQTIAQKILAAVGGSENISHLEHCSTRLRFSLINNQKVDKEALKKIPEVLGVNQTVQTQIIIGNAVIEIYNELEKLLSGKMAAASKKEKQPLTATILDFVISIFQPLIPAIAGGGILKSLLMLLNLVGILSKTTQTYQILNFVGDAPLRFLPILVAVTTANKLKVNPLVALSAVAALLTPDLTAMIVSGAKFFGIALQNINYAYQVFPAILCVLCYAQLEKFFTKVSPKVIRSFFVPMMSLMIVVPFTLIVLGPIGYTFGEGFAAVIMFIFGKVGFIAVGILAAFLPFMVVTGMHKAMIPYVITALGKTGKEVIYCAASLAHNISEAGGCFAVMFRTKDKTLRATALSAGISALFGITEPAIYGVTILHKRVLYGVMIGSLIGGTSLGLMAVEAYVAVGPGLASLSMFISETLPNNLMYAVIGLIISFIASFISVFVLWKEPSSETTTVENTEETEETVTLVAPLEGKVIPLSAVKDDVFSNKMLGDGIAIKPSKGELFAPTDGVIEMVYNTKHALGMKSVDGVEILFHIGIDTVNLKGDYFDVLVSEKQKVVQGQLLVRFDLEKIKAAGFDTTTMIVITNPKHAKIDLNPKTEVIQNEFLMHIEGVV